MSSVDDRIVNMQFNNRQFITGASESQSALEGLERSVANTAKSKGLDDMGRSVDGISSRFSALQVAGISALATIASKATSTGLNLLKSLTIDPLKQGFEEYELNLKSIQTVVANTGLGVGVVGKYMNELNTYSDQTVYSFSQMAQNIGRFTAAGVKVDIATAAIKGMANSAALAGADTNQLNSAMYQMSQALSSGTIRLMDWNSLVNANMGGKNIQQALMDTANTVPEWSSAMKTATADGVGFRDSLQTGWLTADIYTKAMTVMAGQIDKGTHQTVAFSVAQLQAMGYTKKSAIELNKLSAASIESATKIRTITQLFDVVKESVGSGFARVFRGLFGGLNKASDLWTGVNTKISAGLNIMFDSLSQVLRGWRQAGGMTAMWEGIGNIFQIIGNLLKPFVALFQAIFPATNDAGKGLANASKGFASVTGFIEKATRNTELLVPAFTKLGEGIRWLFGQLGSLISIGAKVTVFLTDLGAKGADIAKNLLGGLLGGLDPSSIMSAMVDLAHNIVSSIENALGIHSPATELIPVGKNIVLGIAKGIGDGIIYIIQSLGVLLPKLIAFGGEVVAALAVTILKSVTALFTTVLDVIGKIAPALGDALGSIGGATADSLSAAGEHTGKVWEGVGKVFSFLGAGIGKVFSGLGDAVSFVTGAFTGLFSGGGQGALGFASLLNAVLVGGILLTIRKFMKGISSFMGIADDLHMIFKSVSNAIGDFGDSLKTRANAELIRAVAISIGILAASLFLLSFVDMDKVAIGLGAITYLMGLMAVMMKSLSKIEGGFDMVKMAGAMVLMATAILLLSAAVAILGNMDMKTLAKGLGSIAIALGIFVGAMFLFSKIEGSIGGMAASMLIIALAMNALALAVAAFGNMDMATLGKGLGAMAIGLALLVGSMLVMDHMKGSVEGLALSILTISAAMVVMSVAVGTLGSMDVKTLAKGLGAMAIGLALMVGAVLLLSGNSAGALAGAAAMVLMAAALNGIMVVILALGVAPWEVVARGIGFMAAALAVLLLAALGAQFVAVGLVALGASVLLLGAGMALAGAGMLLFSTGLSILVALGAAGIAVMSAAISAFIALLPQIAIQVAAAFVAFVQTIAAASGPLRDAFGKIFENMIGVITDAMPVIGTLMTALLDTLLDVVTDAIPKFGKLLELLIKTGINVLKVSIPRWVELGFTLIERFLKSAEAHVPEIAGTAADIITKFINKITEKLPGIIKAGTDLIIAFIEGIAKNALRIANAAARAVINFINGLTAAIKKYDGELRDAGLKMALAIANGMSFGLLGKGMDLVTSAAHALGLGANKAASKVMEIESPSKVFYRMGIFLGEGLAQGILQSINGAVRAAVTMANAVISAGDKAVSDAQTEVTYAQSHVAFASARADIFAKRAKEAAKEAAQYAKQHKNDKEGIKKRQKEAADLQKLADVAQKDVERAQKDADKAEQNVADIQAFQDADLTGKGDIKNEKAQQLADRANQMLAKANAEAAEAKRLMKINKKAGQAMLAQAQKDAKAAKALAAQALLANKQANAYYQQELSTQIKQFENDAAFDAADAAGQAAILKERARANEARAKIAQQQALLLIEKAKAVAKKDAAQALKLVKKAQELAEEAKSAADEAKQQKEQAAELLKAPDTTDTSSSSFDSSTPSSTPGSVIAPSRSILEDAASTMDRYTKSLQQASELAGAQAGVVQFVQNNNSPVALSSSEIYRQSKNLLSAAEIKMGVNSSLTP